MRVHLVYPRPCQLHLQSEPQTPSKFQVRTCAAPVSPQGRPPCLRINAGYRDCHSERPRLHLQQDHQRWRRWRETLIAYYYPPGLAFTAPKPIYIQPCTQHLWHRSAPPQKKVLVNAHVFCKNSPTMLRDDLMFMNDRVPVVTS